MTDSEIKAFKNELRNYRFYQKQVDELKGQEDMIYHILGGYKSPDPSKVPGGYNPNMAMQKADLSDKLVVISRRRERFQERIDQLNEVLDQLNPEVRQHMTDIYIGGKPYIQVADSIPIAVSGLYKRINVALRKVPYVMPK